MVAGSWLLLPLLGGVSSCWGGRSSARRWPPPFRRRQTWDVSKPYILSPFDKRGELDQGILRFAWYSLVRVSKGYSLAHPHRNAPRPLARRLGDVQQELRPHHPDPAPGVSAGVAPARSGDLSEARARRHLHHRHVLDVADRAQHRDRSPGHSAGVHERRQGAPALARPRPCSRCFSPRRCLRCSPGFG